MSLLPMFREPVVYVPRTGKANLLFVLFHGNGASPVQLFPLADVLKQAFAQAMVVLPYGFPEHAQATDPVLGQEKTTGIQRYHWGANEHWVSAPDATLQQGALSGLVDQIRSWQQYAGLSGQQTALAGFSQGAALALEAGRQVPDLAGRILAFSGNYVVLPEQAPPATLLHFFHGSNDSVVPLSHVKATLDHLSELQGDATLDIAQGLGHELHQSLMHQAVVRLTTTIPLRSWKEALSGLSEQHQGDTLKGQS